MINFDDPDIKLSSELEHGPVLAWQFLALAIVCALLGITFEVLDYSRPLALILGFITLLALNSWRIHRPKRGT